MRARQAQRLQQEKEAEEQSAAERAYKAMEDMLGKAAAKAWKDAKSASSGTGTSLADAIGSNTAEDCNQAGCSCNSMHSLDTGVNAEVSGSDRTSLKETDCSSTSRVQDKRQAGCSTEGSAPMDFAAAARMLMGQRAAGSLEGQMVPPEASKQGISGCAKAPAEDPRADAGPGARDEHGTKALLAGLGADEPSNVSWSLLQELGARSDIGTVLGEVAARAAAKGLPRRLSKKASLKLTKEVNRR
jgi:hypothetical protein